MSLDSQATLATNVNWTPQIQMALISTAIAVYNEATTVAGHMPRAAFAMQILRGGNYVSQVAYALASLGLSVVSTDTEVLNGISSIWNALAGA